ncbi:MAG: hypothetical protein F2613_01850 [Actinobacteria bacterium]|uniref:Unannotated protein n=1 Tax=freshwater metagenome TaxID=449393 RepID=A0A6J6J748_9ZZZZ|nr:hypothetical protein [Actinomycetota bacterium]
MTNKDELDQRLAKADPAIKRVAPELSDRILTSAIEADSKLTLRARFELLSQNLRRASLGFAVGGSAAAVAVAMVLTSAPAPLIQLSGMQGARNSESAPAQSDVGADKMMMPFVNFEYLAGPDLSNETGSGQVYKLVRQSTPEEVLNNVAAIFGVEGTVKKYPDFAETNPGYFFGQSNDPWGYDGKNPVISLWWSGTASWNYSNPIAYPESKCEKTDTDGNCTTWTEFKPTPELLPTKEEATAKALEVFNATGLDVSASEIRIDASEWGVSASASMYVDGQPTNVEWYLGWSSTGVISYAGGHSVAAEAMGTFDTISALSAVERLADWRWSGSPSGIFYQRFQPPMVGEPAPYVRSGEASSDSAPTDSTIEIDPMPGEQVEPETVTLTVVKSESALLSVWDANGEVWLVPGYILINDQGWFGAVIALIEGVIELPKETEVDIMPLPAEDTGVSNK